MEFYGQQLDAVNVRNEFPGVDCFTKVARFGVILPVQGLLKPVLAYRLCENLCSTTLHKKAPIAVCVQEKKQQQDTTCSLVQVTGAGRNIL